ncbi:TRAP transporter small permease [Nitratireductor thuwali]|uniref:TRAP transporter small permease protein n=1 Tax=Nitratireductor thuwali TaxID=2267699 RepID=A0ABY5MU59_9HYPH|nr:hypothetical protein NTH_04598 [Nitratireductor thuwali]
MRILTFVSRGLFALSAYVCLPAILVLVGIDVVRRYFFHDPLIWAQEAATLTLFLAIVLALPESWRRNVHIKADFLTAIISRGLSDLLARAVWLMLLGVSVLIAIQCWRDIGLMTVFNERSTDLELPLSWFRAVLGVVAVVSGLLALSKLVSREPAGQTHGELS